MSLDDIVSMREISEPRRSPDATRVAFIVKQAFRDCNCSRAAVYVTSTRPAGTPVKLFEDHAISGLRWSPDGQSLTYLSASDGTVQLWLVDGRTGRREQLTRRRAAPRPEYASDSSSSVGILAYEWSPNGRQLAFTSLATPSDGGRDSIQRHGFIYDDETMLYLDLVHKQWPRPSRTQLWVLQPATGTEDLLWEAPDWGQGEEISDIIWSPSGAQIAFSYRSTGADSAGRYPWSQSLGVVTLTTRRFTAVTNGPGNTSQPIWSPDELELGFLVEDPLTSRASLERSDLTGRCRRKVTDLSTTWVRLLRWDAAAAAMILEASGGPGVAPELGGVYAVSLEGSPPQRLTPSNVRTGDCEARPTGAMACVLQSPSRPPAPVLLETAIGSTRAAGIGPALANVNPELASLRLAPVTDLRWKNKHGAETNGFLLAPLEYESGKRYPLLIVLYGFDGHFVTHAGPYQTSYPAQAFARDGFFVLLANYPRFREPAVADYAAGALALGHSPLASWEAAIRLLAERGMVDSTRVGILGHSFGTFLVEYAITHSRLFKAAEVHTAGDYNPGIYWLLGNRYGRDNYERSMGGPPYGSTLKNWVAFSPAFNAHRVRIPVLMEYPPNEALYGLEMFSAFRRNEVPVELVIYPDGDHVFLQPEHRFHSMRRNLDWFNFWLRGFEDSDPARKGQYSRWRAMREQLAREP